MLNIFTILLCILLPPLIYQLDFSQFSDYKQIMLSKVKSADIAAFMMSVEDHAKFILGRISAMSREVDRKIIAYNHMTYTILQSKERQMSSEDKSQVSSQQRVKSEKQMEQLVHLQEEIKKKLRLKTELAMALYNKMADSCEEFENFLQADLNYQEDKDIASFIMDSLASDEITQIIHAEQALELKSSCICNGKEQFQSMIKCESGSCKIRWYHLKCLGIKKRNIPKKKWLCPSCKPSK